MVQKDKRTIVITFRSLATIFGDNPFLDVVDHHSFHFPMIGYQISSNFFPINVLTDMP